MAKKRYHGKADRLLETFKRDIRAGNFDRFSRWPGEARLAELYSVARATIRKVLTALETEGVLRRNGVRREIEQMFREAVPGGMVKVRQRRIALVIPGIDILTNGFSDGICEAARKAGCDCYVFYVSPMNEQKIPEELLAPTLFDGMIMMPLEGRKYHRIFDCWRSASLPVVFLDRRLKGCDATLVEVNNSGGAYRAVGRLLSLYPRPVYFFSNPLEEASSNRERYLGYCNAMRDYGYGALIEEYTTFFTFIDLMTNPEFNSMSGAWRRLKQLKPPLSIFAVNDLAAYAVYIACEELGWRIGIDVKIIGFDDLPWTYRIRPRLSSLRQPSAEIGYECFKLLNRTINGELKEPVTVRIPVTLIEKESSTDEYPHPDDHRYSLCICNIL